MGRGEMSGIHERGKLMVPLSAFSRKKEGEIAKNLSSSLFPGKRVVVVGGCILPHTFTHAPPPPIFYSIHLDLGVGEK